MGLLCLRGLYVCFKWFCVVVATLWICGFDFVAGLLVGVVFRA